MNCILHVIMLCDFGVISLFFQAQRLLDDMLDKTIEVVTNTADIILEKHSPPDDTGVRLFKRAPSGIVFDHTGEKMSTRYKLWNHLLHKNAQTVEIT